MIIKLLGKDYRVRKNSLAYYCVKIVAPAVCILLLIANIYIWFGIAG